MSAPIPSPRQNADERFTISMSAPSLTDADLKAVMQVLRTPRLSMGPQGELFEQAVAEYVGARHAVAVSSGTTGLHLCVRALGIRDGDLVLTTPFSFVASANVILYERAVPIFVDVDPLTGNIDPGAVARAAQDLSQGGSQASKWLPRQGSGSGAQLKALLTVDVFGQPADYDRIAGVAQAYDLGLIEDSCEALGSERNGKAAGTFGDMGAFAFYPNKQITTGEGGMLVTDRDDLAEMARTLRNQGRAPGDEWLEHTYLGYNYRLNELNAALGVAQMKRIDDLIESRAGVAQAYQERLAGLQGVETMSIESGTSRMSWFVYVVKLDPAFDRATVIKRLEEVGIPSRPYFQPIHLQRYFREMFDYRPGDYPVTEDLGSRSLALPFSSIMTASQVDQVVEGLTNTLENLA